jgi:hypothetical protein
MTEDKTCLNCGWAKWFKESPKDGLCKWRSILPKAFEAHLKHLLNRDNPYSDCPCWKPIKEGEI